MCPSKLKTERQTLHEAADAATNYLRTRGGCRKERLLVIPSRVTDAMEFGIHRSAAVALTAGQVSSGYELRHFIGFPVG